MKNADYDYKSVDDINLMCTNEKCSLWLQKCWRYKTYVHKWKKAAYDYKSVDDNIQYLNKCGANHLLVTFKRIRNYTQGL